MTAPKRTYGVKLVRGPVVTVPRHPASVETLGELLDWLGPEEHRRRPVAADLFCGAGGLSIGLTDAGYDVVVGVDHDAAALETHAGLHPGLTLDRDLGDPAALDEVVRILAALRVDLIAGGPPCQPFSRAGRSKLRSLVEAGVRDAHDRRRDLWESYLEIVRRVRPPAVLLENVPDMAVGKDPTILRTIVEVLESAGYSVHTRVLHAVDHGVPQFRQRFILVGLADNGAFEWPEPVPSPATVNDAIGDLPAVEAGFRHADGADGYHPYLVTSRRSALAERARRGMTGPMSRRLHDHITRPVREDDRQIFESMSSTTRYSDIEPGLRRYRSDIFDDKYKRLGGDEPSRSITAHIARDGYWYIHPEQARTLTVREAARIQTFPDHVRFAGPPSAAFRQIGNAVPPLLAQRVAERVLLARRSGTTHDRASSSQISASLARWLERRDGLRLVWLDAPTVWVALQGQLLLDRASVEQTAALWPTIVKLRTPQDTLTAADRLRDEADLAGRADAASRLLAVARWFHDHPEALHSAATLSDAPHVSARVAELVAVVGCSDEAVPVVVTAGTSRVAARVLGETERSRSGTDGRLGVMRLIGGGPDGEVRMAMAGVLELAAAVCRPRRPSCELCPVESQCVARRHDQSVLRLTSGA